MTDAIVDSGSTRTNFAMRIHTADMTPGPDGVVVASIPAEQLLRDFREREDEGEETDEGEEEVEDAEKRKDD